MAATSSNRSLRHRHRHDRRAAGKTVRRIHPSRCLHRSTLRRHGAWPCHHPQARAHDGRRRDRDERTGQGLGVYGAPAGRCDSLTKPADRASRPLPNVRVGTRGNSTGLCLLVTEPQGFESAFWTWDFLDKKCSNIRSKNIFWRSLGNCVFEVKSAFWMHKQPHRRSLRLKGFSLRVQTNLGHRRPGQQRAFPVALRGGSKLSWGSSRGS
jgi:hypothetical protein